MRKLFLFLSVFCLLACSEDNNTPTGLSDNHEIDSLKTVIIGLESANDSLQTRINSINNQLDALQVIIDSLNAFIDLGVTDTFTFPCEEHLLDDDSYGALKAMADDICQGYGFDRANRWSWVEYCTYNPDRYGIYKVICWRAL